MNWIERGSIENISSIHNMDRPRGIAAVALLAELALMLWYSAGVVSTSSGVAGARPGVHVIAVAPALVWPASEVEELTKDTPSPKDEDSAEPVATPGNEGVAPTASSGFGTDPAGGGAPDDVRIVSISPSEMVPLWTGDVINFEVIAEYNLASASSGFLELLIEECTCGDSGPLPENVAEVGADPKRFQVRAGNAAERGRHRQTFTKQIRVPVASSLAVSVHLRGTGATSEPKDDRGYRVTQP
jgi:hypothetical protein